MLGLSFGVARMVSGVAGAELGGRAGGEAGPRWCLLTRVRLLTCMKQNYCWAPRLRPPCGAAGVYRINNLPFSLGVLQGLCGDRWPGAAVNKAVLPRTCPAGSSARARTAFDPAVPAWRRRPSSGATAKCLFITGAARPVPGGAFKSKWHYLRVCHPRGDTAAGCGVFRSCCLSFLQGKPVRGGRAVPGPKQSRVTARGSVRLNPAEARRLWFSFSSSGFRCKKAFQKRNKSPGIAA